MNINRIPRIVLFDMYRSSKEANFCKFLIKLEEKWYNQIMGYAKIEKMWKEE